MKEYRDQVEIFRSAVDEVSRNKDLTLAEAAEQLKDKAAPLIAAREQLASTTACIDAVDADPADDSDANSEDQTKS